jgi:uncharacterized protein DUF4139/uncharacterized protein DUF4140
VIRRPGLNMGPIQEVSVSPLPCPSSIRRVCVHARGALVTRSVELAELPPGPCEVLVEGVTPEADPGSFRVEVLGGRQVTGLQIAHGYRSSPPGASPDQARVAELHQQARSLDLAASQLKHERELLKGTNPRLDLERKDVEPLSRTRDGLAAGALLDELRQGIDARLVEIAAERRALELELNELQRQPAPPTSGGRSTQITVSLGPELSPVEAFSLSYVVRAARWWPSYSARLSAGGREGTWFLNAALAQDSGEDWSGVELALSTADLVSDARLPELKARRLGRAQPAKSKGYRPPPEGLSALFLGYEQALSRASQSAPAGPISLGASADPFGAPNMADGVSALGSSMDRYDDGGDDFGTGAYPALEDSSKELYASEELADYDPFMGEVGAPPPPPASAPAFFAGSAAPPAPPRGRPEAKKMAKGSRSRSAGGGGGGPSLPPPEPLPEPPLEPADAWLDFDRLVLPGRNASRSQRGRLEKAPLVASGGSSNLDSLSGPPHARDPRAERGSFDFQFEARGLADVPTGGALIQVGVEEFSVEVRQVLSVVPAVEDTVYREAELTNPLEVPLLGGPVEVYLNGSLLTTTALEKVGRGGVVRFGLGAEERVRVARNVRTKEETSGLIGKTTAVEHRVSLELRSSLPTPATLRVVDRVPVVASGEDDLNVKFQPGQPPPQRYSQKERGAPLEGGLLWEVELGPGERKELEFGYVLELPAKREVVGGNRRD